MLDSTDRAWTEAALFGNPRIADLATHSGHAKLASPKFQSSTEVALSVEKLTGVGVGQAPKVTYSDSQVHTIVTNIY